MHQIAPELGRRLLRLFALCALAAPCIAVPVLGGAQETPTATETSTPSESRTASATEEASPADTATATATETATMGETPTDTATPSETGTPTETPTPSPTATATETFTQTPIPTEPLPRGCRSTGGADRIECGEVVACALSASGETKNYTFGAVAGDAVCISTAVSLDSQLQPRWTVVGPSFQPVPGCSTRTGGLGCCDDLPATGDYNVIVQDVRDDQTGNYAISLHGVGSLNRDEALNCAAHVSCGSFHTAHLNHPADIDAYRISALAGGALDINTAPLEGSPIEPRWRLFQPDGREVPGCNTAFGGQDNCSDLPESGSYTLVVSDAGSDEFGDYALAVQTTSAANCCAQPIGEGETIEGAFAERGQTDAYAFAADFGVGVNISTAPIPGSAVDPAWRLYGPNGRPVGGCFTTAGGTKSCADLPLRGTYVIVVNDAGSDEVGAYSIALQGPAAAGECVRAPSCAGDCDGNGRVGVDELVRAIDVALGLASVDRCAAADSGRDAVIEIDELVDAVRNSVEGCP